MSKHTTCPRCGMGIDHDGDGNCGVCARLSDEDLARIKASRKGVDTKHAKGCGIRYGRECDCIEDEGDDAS